MDIALAPPPYCEVPSMLPKEPSRPLPGPGAVPPLLWMLMAEVIGGFMLASCSAEVRFEVMFRGEEEAKRFGVAISIGDVGPAMSRPAPSH